MGPWVKEARTFWNVEFARQIAHEATHAANFFTSAPSTGDLDQEIKRGIQDEIATRKSEGRIVQQLGFTAEERAKLEPSGSTEPAEVERDLASEGITYLELFYFSRRLSEAMKDDGIDVRGARQIEAEVERFIEVNSGASEIYLDVSRFQPGKIDPEKSLKRSSEYAQIYFRRQKVFKDWLQFHNRSFGSPEERATAREELLQEHRRTYLIGVSYRPLKRP